MANSDKCATLVGSMISVTNDWYCVNSDIQISNFSGNYRKIQVSMNLSDFIG